LDSAKEDPGGKFNRREGDLMLAVKNSVVALALIAFGIAIGATGIYIGDTDDAPGAALMGLVLMLGAVVAGVRTARRKT
jgi:hypothetical protein